MRKIRGRWFHIAHEPFSPSRYACRLMFCAMNRSARNTAMHDTLVGCAGWSLPSAHAAAFGNGGSALQRYATRLSVVEINSSFYRPHRAATYARWASVVPAGFRFSVKFPQTISHQLRLSGAAPLLDPFLEAAQQLGGKLGALLLQLPPSLAYDGRVASSFLRALRRRTTARVACEPRHASWFSEAADAMLRTHDVARVAANPARFPLAAWPGGTRSWSYWRWHGQPRMYYGRYGEPALRSLAGDLAKRDASGEAWMIFDNTADGSAIADALCLQVLLREKPDA